VIKVFIVGIDGKMGRAVCECISKTDDFELVGGYDVIPDMDFKVFTDTKDMADIDFDVMIDFSRPNTLDIVSEICTKFKKPVVIATTGYNEAELKKIDKLSKTVPVFLSGNMSVGIFIMQKLVELATKNTSGEFDIEIIEKHHNQKVDSPSGTAKMIADTVNSATKNNLDFVYRGHGDNTKRKPNEVGIHSVRGGTIVGEHEVIFAGFDEVITITHSALSRKIFADGALKAAKFLITQKSGLYSMKDMI